MNENYFAVNQSKKIDATYSVKLTIITKIIIRENDGQFCICLVFSRLTEALTMLNVNSDNKFYDRTIHKG